MKDISMWKRCLLELNRLRETKKDQKQKWFFCSSIGVADREFLYRIVPLVYLKIKFIK